MTLAKELLDSFDCTRLKAPLNQAWTLPPTAYTAPEIFTAEIQQIFHKEWVCVGRDEQLPNPGDYRCLDLLDQPIVITRDMQGELHALSRICLHRAMPIADGCGNATRLLCPYHHWTYELDGQLRSAPMMDGADDFVAGQLSLPKLQLEVWHGFIFVNADPAAAPLAPQVSGLDALVKDYEFENLVVVKTLEFDSPWNWKILVENFMEAYHHIGPHQHTFEPVYPARDSSVEDNDGQPWSFLRMPGKHGPHDDMTSFPNLPDERRAELFAACIFPTFLFAATNSNGAWYQLHPKGPGEMHLQIHALLHKDLAAAADEQALTEMGEILSAIHHEDITVNEGPWLGLNAPMTTQGRLSPYEKAIWQLNQYWAERLGI